MDEMNSKKYASLRSLQYFLDNLKETFSDVSHTHTVDEITNFPNIEAIVCEHIYGAVNTISNDNAIYVRDYAFYQHEHLVTAEFSNVITIGDYSFYKCPNLTSASAPMVTNIGEFAFRGCPLVSIDYPMAITIGQGAFDECTALSSVNLPLVTTIEPLTFRKCESLTSANLPYVKSIGTQAFYDSGIASLTLDSSTVVVLEDESAFYFTPIEEGTGYIYVPSNLVDSYKSADGWSTYANQILAIA